MAVTWEGWQTDVSNAARPTGPLTLRQRSKYGASDEEQNEFARKHPDVIITLRRRQGNRNESEARG